MPKTVIARFLDQVIVELQARNADGAARNTWRAAATLEPADRAGREEHERQRLLLLADRVARVWVPAAIELMRDETLTELARQVPRVQSGADAAHAASTTRSLRSLVAKVPAGPRPATPVDVAAALVELELALTRTAAIESDGVARTAVVMVPHAARGLVLTFFAGAPLDGMPSEATATIRILDALDDERGVDWGHRPVEQTAAEGGVHRTLVQSLASTLARASGAITHADGVGTLPEPPRVGRHRPDLVGRDVAGHDFLGEAKLGPDLYDTHSQEQLADFSTYAPDGERCHFHLVVPAGWRDEAERAITAAGGVVDDAVTIHDVGGIAGAPSPPAGPGRAA